MKPMHRHKQPQTHKEGKEIPANTPKTYKDSSALRNLSLQVFVALYLGYGSIYFTRKPFTVVKSFIQDDLQLSTRMLGLLDTAFLVCYASGAFFVPGLGDTYGIRQMLTFGMVGSALCASVFGIATNHELLFVSWCFNGLCQAGLFPLCVRALDAIADGSNRGKMVGAWSTSQNVGAALASVFASFIVSFTEWEMAFVLPGAFVIVCALVVYWLLPPDINEACAMARQAGSREMVPLTTDRSGDMSPTTADTVVIEPVASNKKLDFDLPEDSPAAHAQSVPVSHAHGVTPGNAASTVKKPSFCTILLIPGLVNMGAAYFCIKMVRYTMMFWLPYFLNKEFGYSRAASGMLSTLFDIGGIVGALLAGYVSDKYAQGRRTTVIGTMAIFSAGMLALYSKVGPVGLMVNAITLTAAGIAVAGADSLMSGAAVQDFMEQSSVGKSGLTVAAGIVNGFGSTGAAMQGLLTSYIATSLGWWAFFPALVILSTAGFVILLPMILKDFGWAPAVAWFRPTREPPAEADYEMVSNPA